MTLSPAERTVRARLTAHSFHAQGNSRDHTEPARRAFMSRFEDEVDPNRVLDAAHRNSPDRLTGIPTSPWMIRISRSCPVHDGCATLR